MAMNPRLLRPRASGFNPKSIAGLVLWLDGSDRTTMYDATSGGSLVADNGGVARWEDKSGNAHHATQGTSNDRPLVRPNTKAGKAVLEFDGSSDFMRVADANALDLNTFSVFSVVRLSTYTTTTVRGPAIINKGDYATAAGTAYELTTSAGLSPKWSTGIASGGTFSAVSSGAADVAQNTWTLVSSRRAAASAAFVFVNKVSAGSTSVVSGTLNNVSAGIGIGARGSGTPAASVDLFPGNIAELLIYNFAMTDTERSAVESWLVGKWAI